MGVSCDPPDVNHRFISKLDLPFTILSDPAHLLVKKLGIPVSTRHPMAKIRKYPHGFTQPAVFVFGRQGKRLFSWIQRPRLMNLFGATRRLGPEEILRQVEELAHKGNR